jgi:hypothetical protein
MRWADRIRANRFGIDTNRFTIDAVGIINVPPRSAFGIVQLDMRWCRAGHSGPSSIDRPALFRHRLGMSFRGRHGAGRLF